VDGGGSKNQGVHDRGAREDGFAPSPLHGVGIMTPPVIVGAGPAGLAAAATLLHAGLRPIVLEEAAHPGGQGTRRLTPAMTSVAARLLGHRAACDAIEREATEDRILAACDWRPGSLVWGHHDQQLMVLQEGHHTTVAYDQLLIATGAIDRVLAFPGWTLPGVFTLGAAQVALKQHAAFIGNPVGKHIVLAGASPLLYLAAAQYLRLGVRDLTIVEYAQPMQQCRAAIGMAWYAPVTLAEGVRLLWELRRAGIRRIGGAALVRARGESRLVAIDIRHASGRIETLPCDALAFGYGLRPETQLAELAGARFYCHPVWRDWFAVIDADGQAGPRLWLAGETAMTGGRVAAAASGRLAALAMLAARPGHAPVRGNDMAALRRRVARLRQFQIHMARAFPWPHATAGMLPDATIVCRCERVTAADIRRALTKPAAPTDINRVKAVTRCGMGRCQGRYCAPTLQELIAVTRACPLDTVGRLRAQAPVRPIAIGSTTGETAYGQP